MRIYYDTEFFENGQTIELLSIGMVAEDGRELYRVVDDNDDAYTEAALDPWLRDNVLSSLPVLLNPRKTLTWDWNPEHPDWPNVMSRPEIAMHVREFIQETPNVELWAWYGAYDHVALCQLWGRMINLPEGVPMWTNDLRQEVARLGDIRLPDQPSGLHNALADARHLKFRAEYLASAELAADK